MKFGAMEKYCSINTKGEAMNKRASVFHIERVNEERGIIWIVDDGANKPVLSVTNDAERVCQVINAQYPDFQIIYRDSNGDWDELVHEHGVFKRFVVARNMAP